MEARMPLPSPLRFGVSLIYGGKTPLDDARRFADALAARLGQPVEPQVASNYRELTDGVLSGDVHLAWMPPLTHARATQKGAVLACVMERRGALSYRSALLVRTDSVHVALTGLRGVRVAWTDPSSASGWLYPRLHLLAHGVDPRRDITHEAFCGTPVAAVGAVVRREADLCACFVTAAAYQDPEQALTDVERIYPGAREHLRVLAVTDLIPPDALVLAAGLDAEAQAEVTRVLLGMHNQLDGRAALHDLMQAERLLPVSDEVHRLVARLRAHVHV
jgi:phosphonate transport system substrate-binding protein